MMCRCVMGAHCTPTRSDCRLRAGGSLNDGGGVCGTSGAHEASPVVSVAQLREWIEQERTRNVGMYRDTVQGEAYAQGDAHAIGRLSAWLDDQEAGSRDA
jgi:hypothetical protein